MKFEIVEIEKLSGAKCTIYTIQYENGSTLFDDFLQLNKSDYPDEVADIIRRIKSMSRLYGTREDYFKLNYGNPGDGVCALFDSEEKKLRLICIRFPNVAILIGDGGPKNVRAFQDDPLLHKKVDEMKIISSLILQKILEKEIKWSKDQTRLEGDLIIEIDLYGRS